VTGEARGTSARTGPAFLTWCRTVLSAHASPYPKLGLMRAAGAPRLPGRSGRVARLAHQGASRPAGALSPMRRSPATRRDLGALAKAVRERVDERILAIANNPRPPGVEKLAGIENRPLSLKEIRTDWLDLGDNGAARVWVTPWAVTCRDQFAAFRPGFAIIGRRVIARSARATACSRSGRFHRPAARSRARGWSADSLHCKPRTIPPAYPLPPSPRSY
jgi:hypothetical protein